MNIDEQIKKWVMIDDQLKLINEQTQKLRVVKQKLTENIVNNHSLLNKNIPISGGQLKIVNNKSVQNITFKYLETCLREIIKNETQIQQIIQYIKNKREIKNNFEIKRYYIDEGN